jgi:FixJ family two-component response regulator
MKTVGKSTGDYNTIFIVDPDEMHRARVSSLLNGLGYSTLKFSSAEDFLNDLKDTATGCIISEIDLPGINGLELLQELKGRDIELPVIFVTGHKNLSTAVEACRMRVADYLVKPYIGKTLVERVRKVLEEYSASGT